MLHVGLHSKGASRKSFQSRGMWPGNPRRRLVIESGVNFRRTACCFFRACGNIFESRLRRTLVPLLYYRRNNRPTQIRSAKQSTDWQNYDLVGKTVPFLGKSCSVAVPRRLNSSSKLECVCKKDNVGIPNNTSFWSED